MSLQQSALVAPAFDEAQQAAPLGRTLALAGSAKRRLALATALGACTAGFGIALLATSAWLISRAAERPSVVVLGAAIVGVRFFAVSRGLSRYGERLVGHDAALRVLADLRVRVYERLEALAPSGLPAFRRGDLLARIVEDVDSVQDLMLRVIPPFAIALAVGIPAVALVWYLLPAAGEALAICLLAGATLVPWLAGHAARRREARLAAARGELTAHLVDLVEGAPELIAFGATDAQIARISAADEELTRIATAASSTAGTGSALVTLVIGAAVWTALLFGVPAVHSGRLQGAWLAVIVLVPLAAAELLTGLPAAAQYLQQVRRAAARVFAVVDAEPPVVDPEVPAALPGRPFSLEASGLRARYGPDLPWALDGIDLSLPPGRRLGVVGPSGSGKSTLAAVLLRFLPAGGGSVTLDGISYADLAGEDVRKVVGLASQDTHVFETTLRENLLLARRAATEAELWSALERVRLGDWVESLPDGLDTEVGGHGVRMSGGQRQRLGLARVLIADFPVLVLDEPGEHLDTPTADALVADAVELTDARTTVLITHRLAGLESMDEIIVLDGGRVVERGTHRELLSAGGRYAAQWEREARLDLEPPLAERSVAS